MKRAILDPPAWFWELFDEAKGDDAKFAELLQHLNQRQLTLAYSYMRDLATALTGPDYQPYLPAGISDEGEFEVGLWAVTQGRDHYREVRLDPSKIPRIDLPGHRSERMMYGKIAEVYYDRFDEEIPTDFPIEWNYDGSAATL
jgi:hypothetical protein